MAAEAFQNPEWADHMMVRINGRDFPTNLYNGVQRFVPDPDVLALVRLSTNNFHGPASGRAPVSFYDQIPESLRTKPHANSVVNHFVAQNLYGYYGLNELALDFYEEKFDLEDFIEFETLHGWSVDGFYSSLTQKLSNAGFAKPFIDPETGEEDEDYEDYSDYFDFSNPLWDDE